MHGGVAKEGLGKPNVEALRKGCANLGRHVDNVKQFGVPVVVAINRFTSDTVEEIAAIKEYATAHGVEAILCEHWAKGSEGTVELANAVVQLAESGRAQFSPLYNGDLPLGRRSPPWSRAFRPTRRSPTTHPRPAACLGQGRL
jgi:formate--tetrahydrofolate ligase